MPTKLHLQPASPPAPQVHLPRLPSTPENIPPELRQAHHTLAVSRRDKPIRRPQAVYWGSIRARGGEGEGEGLQGAVLPGQEEAFVVYECGVEGGGALGREAASEGEGLGSGVW